MDQANVVVVGGGFVGCAIARTLSAKWEDVFFSRGAAEARDGRELAQQVE